MRISLRFGLSEDRNRAGGSGHTTPLAVIVTLFFVIAISVLAAVFSLIFRKPKPIVFHGPHMEESVFSDPSLQAFEPVATEPLPEPKISAGRSREYGIAAGGELTSKSQAELDRYFGSLRELGVRWVRWDVDWSVIQSAGAENYDWRGTDRVAATADRFGIHSLGIVTYAPGWAKKAGCPAESQCAPRDVASFARFAATAADRYRDSILYWEIWNEPNIPLFWGPKPSAKRYAEALRLASDAIRNANPRAVIISGGLAAAGNDPDGSVAPADFVRELYRYGAKDAFDAMAVHPYTYPVLPGYDVAWNNWKAVRSVHDVMAENGDGNKEVWITEYGAPTGGPGTYFSVNHVRSFRFGVDYMDESSQGAMMAETLSYYSRNSDWIGLFFWYSLRDNGTSRETPENFFGLLRHDWSKKPAYDVFRQAIVSTE